MNGQLTIFLNGKFIKMSIADVEQLRPGLIAGRGAFETIRADGKKIHFFNDHWKRMIIALRIFEIPLTSSKEDVLAIIEQLIKINSLKVSRVRVMVWRDAVRYHSAVMCLPYKDAPKKGMHLCYSVLVRNLSRHSRVKSINYALFHKAHNEAIQKGFDEAILKNSKGYVVEGAYSNIFMVENGILKTPKIICGALSGVTRRKVITLARQNQIPVDTGYLTPSQLAKADEVFLTNSMAGIIPVTKIEGAVIGSGVAGKTTVCLTRLYKSAVK